MPQPQAPPGISSQRGNSAMGEPNPKRWQVQDRCSICSIEFSLMNKRHHCRSCGLSVCGRHSKNRAIVPTSLSKAQQRVCDSCYPKCRSGTAMELAPPAPPVRQDLPADEARRHTLMLRNERDDGRRIRSPPDALRRAAQEARRDRNDGSNRAWNSDDEPIRVMRRDEKEPRTMQSARVRRLRSPGAQYLHGRDPREVVSSRGRSTRDGDLHFRDLSTDRTDPRRNRDPRDREGRNSDPRERDPRARDLRERNLRARDPRERDLRARDLRGKDPRERHSHERDPRERDLRERDPRERDLRARDLRERDPRARDPRERDPRARDPRERDPRERDPRERDPRERDPRARDPRERDPRARDPRERDPRERDPRERDPRERDPRERDPRERDPRKRDPRERDPRERDPRERDPRVRDPRERGVRERDPRERDPREKDPRERDRRIRDPRERGPHRNDPHEKDTRERERRKRDLRERDPRERERPRDRALHERDLFDAAPREKSSRDSLGQKERRRRVLNSEPIRRQSHKKLLDPAFGSESGNQRSETSSTCRTTSSTLSSFYAAVNAVEDTKAKAPSPKSKPKRSLPRKEKELKSAFADSAFSIFSLAGSDHSDSESKPQKNAVQKTRRRGKSRSTSVNREPMEKKEHLDFSASSSSVKCFEVSAITQKYLNPKPAVAAMEKTSLKPMTEEENESEDSNAGPSRRNADRRGHTSERRRNVRPSSQGKHCSKSRDKEQSDDQMPPFRRGKPVDESFRDSGEFLQEQEKSSDQNADPKPKRSLSISEDNGFEATQLLLSSDNCFGDDDDEEDDANRRKQDLAAKLRAKKAAIAGIDPASLDAKEKAPTTANYKLTKRDQEIMQQISELERVVLQHNNDLLNLLDMYSEATKRAQNAQKGLKKAKVRVARYEKAHAAVSRAIRSGKVYMTQKEYMAAILEISRATGIERSNATLWYMLAECRLMVSQPVAAEDACMMCLKLHPTGAAVALLGRIMHERGRNDEAIECYLEALGRNDESESEEDSECL